MSLCSACSERVRTSGLCSETLRVLPAHERKRRQVFAAYSSSVRLLELCHRFNAALLASAQSAAGGPSLTDKQPEAQAVAVQRTRLRLGRQTRAHARGSRFCGRDRSQVALHATNHEPTMLSLVPARGVAHHILSTSRAGEEAQCAFFVDRFWRICARLRADTAARSLVYALLVGCVGTPRPSEVHLQRVVPTRAVHCIMKRNAETAKQRTITLVPASEPMPLEAFKTALLKRRCVAQRRETSTLRKALTRRALSIVLAKQKAVQLAEEAIANPPPAPAPDSAEAVAAAAAAAEHAARVQEVTRLNKAQEESYRAALQAWEQETASARRAERERLVSAMTSRRAARATEQAGIEEKL